MPNSTFGTDQAELPSAAGFGNQNGDNFNGSDDGLLSFYGVDPIAQPTVAAAVSTTASTTTTLAAGYETTTQADAIVTLVNSLRTNAIALGLMAAA